MRKLILAVAAIVISAGAYAQVDSTHRKTSEQDWKNNQETNAQNKPVDKTHPDGVLMQNGVMLKVLNGRMTILQDNEVAMSNGTRVMRDGTYITKDGLKTMMKEGQHMDMLGNMLPMKTDHEKKMHHLHDSTRNKDN